MHVGCRVQGSADKGQYLLEPRRNCNFAEQAPQPTLEQTLAEPVTLAARFLPVDSVPPTKVRRCNIPSHHWDDVIERW
jgi:hypothetical protein